MALGVHPPSLHHPYSPRPNLPIFLLGPMFEFRLQKVLEYRARLEGFAKDAYLDSRAARLSAEATVHEIRSRRGYLLESTPSDLNSRRALESTLLSIDDEERAQIVVQKVLISEEEAAMQAWTFAKRELESLVRLRESALKEYEHEQLREEQKELDDWAILRRKAA